MLFVLIETVIMHWATKSIRVLPRVLLAFILSNDLKRGNRNIRKVNPLSPHPLTTKDKILKKVPHRIKETLHTFFFSWRPI